MHALPIIALVIAIAAYVRARRASSWACSGDTGHACGPGAGRSCHRGHRGGWRGWHRHGRGQRALLYHVFARLDLSPAQEKALRSEVFALRDKLGELRGEGKDTRADLAAALRADTLDDSALSAMFARHDDRLATVRADLAASLRRVHDVLDEQQRHRLADLVSGDWRAWRGPYR